MSKNSSGKWALGALLAATAGYLTGILTAPKSGKETRKDIQEKTLKARAEAERQLKKLHTELSGYVDRGKKKAETMTSKAKTEMTEVVNRAQDVRQKASELLSAVHEGEADDKDLQKAIAEVKKANTHLKAYLDKNDKQAKKAK